jgi:hypothetical protein
MLTQMILTLEHPELFRNGCNKEYLSHTFSAPMVIKEARRRNTLAKRCQLCANVNNEQHVLHSASAMLHF